jgi:hypothetical protein
MKIRQEYNLPKLKPVNGREYGPLPDTPPGKYAQVDFGEYRLRKGDGSKIKVLFVSSMGYPGLSSMIKTLFSFMMKI